MNFTYIFIINLDKIWAGFLNFGEPIPPGQRKMETQPPGIVKPVWRLWHEFAYAFGLYSAKSSRQGHFSPSLSQNRTWYSRIIRLLLYHHTYL